MEVVFSQRAIAAVMAETAEKIQTETGGLFLGKVIGDTWYVVESIDPGPNSIFEVAYFEYDPPYVGCGIVIRGLLTSSRGRTIKLITSMRPCGRREQSRFWSILIRISV